MQLLLISAIVVKSNINSAIGYSLIIRLIKTDCKDADFPITNMQITSTALKYWWYVDICQLMLKYNKVTILIQFNFQYYTSDTINDSKKLKTVQQNPASTTTYILVDHVRSGSLDSGIGLYMKHCPQLCRHNFDQKNQQKMANK